MDNSDMIIIYPTGHLITVTLPETLEHKLFIKNSGYKDVLIKIPESQTITIGGNDA